MTATANAIASTVLAQFDKLPAKRKPAVRDNGLHEWVPLSGIVLEKDGHFTCLSLATGMKCLPASKLHACNGVGIHDWHAEVLAIRAFNRYLLDECSRLLQDEQSSEILTTSASDSRQASFEIREGVKLHMYCSEAPCGDASMELTMAAQEDATPWAAGRDAQDSSANQDTLPGRGFFSQLGIVRRKPARGDAPPSMSKSCSDKLAAKQCLSLLCSVTALFVDPGKAYIDTLVLPDDRYSVAGCSRSFGAEGRLKPVSQSGWGDGYAFRPFKVQTTDLKFDFSKTSVDQRGGKLSASNLAAAWTASGVEETILGGVVQGRKAFDIKGASHMSRRAMWSKGKQLDELLGDQHCLSVQVYRDIKELPAVAARASVKAEVRGKALPGWIRNEGDEDFRLE